MRFIHQLALGPFGPDVEIHRWSVSNEASIRGAKYVRHRGIQSSVKGSCVIFGPSQVRRG